MSCSLEILSIYQQIFALHEHTIIFEQHVWVLYMHLTFKIIIVFVDVFCSLISQLFKKC